MDKTLEQITEEEKQNEKNSFIATKSRVEHECIPPSIRDFNKVVQAEQVCWFVLFKMSNLFNFVIYWKVDLSAKLQEDPLVAIKKREEESRREFLQNPVQLKKLQKALKAQQEKQNKKKKKKKSKKKQNSDSDLDVKLTEKLLGLKNKKNSRDERNLDTILIHKYEEFKHLLTDEDMRQVLAGKMINSDEEVGEGKQKSKRKSQNKSNSDEDSEDGSKVKRKKKEKRSKSEMSEDSTDENRDYRKRKDKYLNNDQQKTADRQNRDKSSGSKYNEHNREYNKADKHKSSIHKKNKYERRDDKAFYKTSDRSSTNQKSSKNKKNHESTTSDSSSESEDERKRNYDSDDSNPSKHHRRHFGLVTSEGKKLILNKNYPDQIKKSKTVLPEPPKPSFQPHKSKRLTEEEKEKLRKEMMQNATAREKERSHNLKKYRQDEAKESKNQKYDPEFIHRQLLKTAETGTVESRIKSNLNNIQRSSRDMDRNFSRR